MAENNEMEMYNQVIPLVISIPADKRILFYLMEHSKRERDSALKVLCSNGSVKENAMGKNRENLPLILGARGC